MLLPRMVCFTVSGSDHFSRQDTGVFRGESFPEREIPTIRVDDSVRFSPYASYGRPMQALIDARAAVEAAIEAERDAALELHDQGRSWSEIGDAVGLSAEGARSRYATVVVDGVRQRISVEAPLPGVSLQDYANSLCVVLRRVREMVRDGEVETVTVPYRGRMVTRIVAERT